MKKMDKKMSKKIEEKEAGKKGIQAIEKMDKKKERK